MLWYLPHGLPTKSRPTITPKTFFIPTRLLHCILSPHLIQSFFLWPTIFFFFHPFCYFPFIYLFFHFAFCIHFFFFALLSFNIFLFISPLTFFFCVHIVFQYEIYIRKSNICSIHEFKQTLSGKNSIKNIKQNNNDEMNLINLSINKFLLLSWLNR